MSCTVPQEEGTVRLEIPLGRLRVTRDALGLKLLSVKFNTATRKWIVIARRKGMDDLTHSP